MAADGPEIKTAKNKCIQRSGLDKDDFFSPAPGTRTRGHRLKVAKKPAISRVRRNHFATRVVSDWSALPEEVVCSPSTNVFKNPMIPKCQVSGIR